MTNKKSDLTMFLQIPDDVHLLLRENHAGEQLFCFFFYYLPAKKNA
jgi:hypothetical protein